MKTIKVSILICLFGLLFVGYSFSGNSVTDPSPANIVGWGTNYEYREINPPYWYPGDMAGDTMFVGSEGVSGGYFLLVALINPGFETCLTDHSQIMEVKAKWLGEPEYESSLLPDTCLNQIPYAGPAYQKTQAWLILLRPAVWQFQGTWEFTLKYHCPIDGKKHIQTRVVQPNPPNTIPPKPTGILIEKSSAGDYFYVSWIGMGNPFTRPGLSYRVFVYSDEDNCPTNFYGTGFGQSASYDDFSNRITISVPTTHAGKTIRIENRNTRGVTPPTGTLGGTPNRGLLRTRLPE